MYLHFMQLSVTTWVISLPSRQRFGRHKMYLICLFLRAKRNMKHISFDRSWSHGSRHRRVWQRSERFQSAWPRNISARNRGKASAGGAIALATCHFVPTDGGDLAGYRWSIERKRELGKGAKDGHR
jgi:hypothetical protein